MKSFYIPPATDIPRLLNGEIGAVLVMVKPNQFKKVGICCSPMPGINHHGYCDECAGYSEVTEPDFNKSPFALDVKIAVKETWGKIDMSDEDDFSEGCYVYKSCEDSKELLEPPGYGDCFMGWRSPATMPITAVRMWMVPYEVKVVRVQSVTEEDMLDIVMSKSVDTGGDDSYTYFRNYLGPQEESEWPWFGETKDGLRQSFRSYIISRHGQTAWENNEIGFFYKFRIEPTH